LCLIVLCDKATSVIRLFIPLTGHRLDFPAMTNVVEFGMDALKGSLFNPGVVSRSRLDLSSHATPHCEN
jgi:hypothetical protein